MKILENLEHIISSLPGIGSRSSKRMVLYMLSHKEKFLKILPELMFSAYNQIKRCKICGNLDETEICSICSNSNRENHLCIVESILDLHSIEKAEYYNGFYHILWGKLSAIENISPENLNLESLKIRILNSNFDEIIIAISSTVAGQTTAFFIKDILEEIKIENNKNFKISILGKGIPVGSEIDYLDEGTIIASFKARGEM